MRTLSVYPNPFVQLDHEGVPCGAYPFDPGHANGARRWVGAVIDTGRLKPIAVKTTGPQDSAPGAALMRLDGKPVGDVPAAPGKPARKAPRSVNGYPRFRTMFAFNLKPQTVPDNEHYRRGIRAGELFAADEATARECKVECRPLDEALRDARTAAIAAWRDQHESDPDFNLWPENLRPAGSDA